MQRDEDDIDVDTPADVFDDVHRERDGLGCRLDLVLGIGVILDDCFNVNLLIDGDIILLFILRNGAGLSAVLLPHLITLDKQVDDVVEDKGKCHACQYPV